MRRADNAHAELQRPALWASLARRSWSGADAISVMQADVSLDADPPVLIPGQGALLWELRPDLQVAFPLDTSQSVAAYLTWILGDGCVEGVLEPALFTPAFLAFLEQPSPPDLTPWPFDDLVETWGLRLTCGIGHARELFPNWNGSRASPPSNLAHVLWFVWVAPRLFGWPAFLGSSLRRALQEPCGLESDGYPFSLGALELGRSRPDLRQVFDTGTGLGRAALLRWLVLDGVRELGCTFEDFDPALAKWLLSRCPGTMLPNWLTLIRESRPDLQQAFSSDPAGLVAWSVHDFPKDYLGHPLVELTGLRPPLDPEVSAPIVLTGVWGSPSGRGQDLRSTAAALLAAGQEDFLIFDLETRDVLDSSGYPLKKGIRVKACVNLVHGNADSALVDWRAARAAQIQVDWTIGWWAWELEWLPSWWQAAFAFCDEIWAATDFAHYAFSKSADRPVRLMLMAVEAPAPDCLPDLRSRFGISSAVTLFLTSFDLGSYPSRKNPEAAVQAFCRAFPNGNEAAALLIKAQRTEAAPGAWQALKALATVDPRIQCVEVSLTRAEHLALTAQSDALVSLHRSEGFGRGPAEAMALGRPTIVTAYSGNLDFTCSETALMVGYHLVAVEAHQYPGVEGQRWAEPDTTQAAAHMRTVHDSPEKLEEMTFAARVKIEDFYGPEIVGPILARALARSPRPA